MDKYQKQILKRQYGTKEETWTETIFTGILILFMLAVITFIILMILSSPFLKK